MFHHQAVLCHDEKPSEVHLWCTAGDNERVALIDSQGQCIAVKGPNDLAGAAAVAVERQDRNGDTIMYGSVPGHKDPTNIVCSGHTLSPH